jgi:hypothetical protein
VSERVNVRVSVRVRKVCAKEERLKDMRTREGEREVNTWVLRPGSVSVQDSLQYINATPALPSARNGPLLA